MVASRWNCTGSQSGQRGHREEGWEGHGQSDQSPVCKVGQLDWGGGERLPLERLMGGPHVACQICPLSLVAWRQRDDPMSHVDLKGHNEQHISQFFSNELMVETYYKSLVRALGKVLLTKYS